MKTALVTGCTGQDGSYLVDLLLAKGYRVIGLKRRTSRINTDNIDHVYNHPNFKLCYGAANDTGSVYRILLQCKPDEIYNLQAQSHVRVSFDVPEETVDTVAMGTLRLLEAIRNVCPTAKFYQASSSEMYGDNVQVPQDENTQMMPASPYAAAKLFSHNLVRNYRVGYGIHASSGIMFNHESPRRGETFVTRKITMAAAKIKLGMQDTLKLGNLDAMRDWGFAGDYVEAMWLMLQQQEPDDYVVATGVSHSVREFLEKVFEIAGISVQKHLKIDKNLFRPHEVPYLLGNASKAKRVLGWQSKTSFEDLARMMYDADLAICKSARM
jgi:GDPmannose 4,6-dehydratase